MLAIYALIFFIPKNIAFSYSQPTCVAQLTIAPQLSKTTGPAAANYKISYENPVKIGALTLASTRICFKPQKQLLADIQTVKISPFGGWFAQKQLSLKVPEAPKLVTNNFGKNAISSVLPLKLELTSTDIIHDYTLVVDPEQPGSKSANLTPAGSKSTNSEPSDPKTANCQVQNSTLNCQVAALQLQPAKQYNLALRKTVKDQPGQAATKLMQSTVAILDPINLVSASLQNDQTLYDAPTSFTFKFDQQLQSAQAQLTKVQGETAQPLASQTSISGDTLTVTFDQLARSSQHKLTITGVIANDGRTLAEPLTLNFGTSGGPKVSQVSAGSSGSARNEKIIITFDQPVDPTVDPAQTVKVSGAAAIITRISPSQWAVTLQNANLCASVNLTIDKGLKSGSNSASSSDDWSFRTRVVCGELRTIGYSVKGRPITAYYFGSGATTILFTGGMHGSEPSGQATMQAWAQYLMTNGDKIPADKRVVIVANTNPDGIAAGSRNNANNVNLDRNFPTANWKANIETTSGILTNGGGASPASEPETQALINLTRQLRPRLQISYHAQGQLVGANKYGDSVALGSSYGATVGYKTMFYDAEAVMGYPMTGEYEDWIGEEMGLAALLIELPTLSGNYLQSQLPAMLKIITQTSNG